MTIGTEQCYGCRKELNVYQTDGGLRSDDDIAMNLPGIVCFDCSFDLVNKVPDPPGLVCVRELTPATAVAALETREFLRPAEEAVLFFIHLFPTNSQVIAACGTILDWP
jgi:hypothetical protein